MNGLPIVRLGSGQKGDGINGSPFYGGGIPFVDGLVSEQFVRDGEIKPDEFEGFGACQGVDELFRMDIEGQVPPIQAEGSDGGILHGGGG